MADHLGDSAGDAVERLASKRATRDANNNASGHGGALVGGGKQARPCESTARSSSSASRRSEGSNLSECTTADSEQGWHLLDVDERDSCPLLSSGSSSVSLGAAGAGAGEVATSANKLNNLHEMPKGDTTKPATVVMTKGQKIVHSAGKSSASSMRPTPTTTTSSKFIVIDNHEARAKLSRVLVHLCTGLYSLMPLASLVAFITLISLLFTKLWFLTLAYYTWILLIDSKTCNRGGRRWRWVHNSKFWTYLAAYFPIRLRHSRHFQLKPSENYILNYHPHGISAFGCVTTFATNGLQFEKLFPGIWSRFMVHETSFLVPVMRETFGLRGDCSVNSASFDYILSKKWRREQEEQEKSTSMADGAGGGHQERRARTQPTKGAQPATGNLLALCGGGLAEADLSHMDTLKIVCATRKGFVKKALIHGAHLVPCIAFGENSVFKKVNLRRGSLLHRLETKFYQLFKFRHPIYYGESLLGASKLSGLMPFRRPITVCMADPIEVARVPEPSQKQIDHFHALYMERLRALYEDHRDLCTEYDRKMELL